MIRQDYQNSICVPVSASEAQGKIVRVSEWWTQYVEGNCSNLGDVFTVRFSEDFGGTFVEFRITEAAPGSRVVWHVDDCYLPWLKDKTEWNDTNVVFEVSASGTGAMVTITHEGLTPAIECYEACKQGWNRYFGQSLKQFLTDGCGMPN